MNFRFKKKYFLGLFFLILILYLFWGPLFPWSPVKPGFSIIEKKWATVYFQEFEDDIAVNNLDDIINELENFHGLKFNEEFKIIILGKHSNMKRYLPWMSGSGYSVKLGFANVIYIGANARNSRYGIGVFLKHELSHLLIHQNVPSAKYNFEIQKQGWLAEGIAAYIGGPYYYNKDEFVPLWKNNGMSFNSLYETDVLQVEKDIIRLYYTYYRFFIEFLINTFGLEKFREYLKTYINDPEQYIPAFYDIYGKNLNEILSLFSLYMNIDK